MYQVVRVVSCGIVPVSLIRIVSDRPSPAVDAIQCSCEIDVAIYPQRVITCIRNVIGAADEWSVAYLERYVDQSLVPSRHACQHTGVSSGTVLAALASAVGRVRVLGEYHVRLRVLASPYTTGGPFVGLPVLQPIDDDCRAKLVMQCLVIDAADARDDKERRIESGERTSTLTVVSRNGVVISFKVMVYTLASVSRLEGTILSFYQFQVDGTSVKLVAVPVGVYL